MAAMRCTICNLNYPLHITICPVCDAQTWWSKQDEPEELWQWHAELRRKQIEAQLVEAITGFKPIEIPYLPVPVLEAVEGKAWTIKLLDVYSLDRRKLLLREGQIVEIPDEDGERHLYEVGGTTRQSAGASRYLLYRIACPDYVPEGILDGD